MMRPYVTIVKDSFDEAFASRVLYILLAVATVVLLAIVPIGVTEERASRLQVGSVANWPALIAKIKRDASAETPSPGKRIWDLADADLRRTIDETLRGDAPPEVTRETAARLIDGFNRLIEGNDLYEEPAWADVGLDRTTKRLLGEEAENPTSAGRLLLNRRLLKAAFPAEIAGAPDKELRLSYLGWGVGSPLPVSLKLAEPFVRQFIARAMDFLVGTVAVFIAVLVTAPMIPRTFEPGAVDLLLSKPVARPLLFLAKFFGGCAFILVVAGYFVVGLWLVLGLRFGLWIATLPACIPVFLFLFAIYYSVSAWAGVVWKNATVSIVLTMLFWAACFLVGTAKNVIERFFINPARIVSLTPLGGDLMAGNQSGDFLEWRSGAWETVLLAERGRGPRGPGGPQVIGPVALGESNRLVYLEIPRAHGFGLLRRGPQLNIATWANGTWSRRSGPTPPADITCLFASPQGGLLAVGTSGIYRLDEESLAGGGTSLFGFTLPLGGGDAFVPVGPKTPLELHEGFAAAVSPVSGDLFLLDAQTLSRLTWDGQRYRLADSSPLETVSPTAAMACGGKEIVAACSDGRIFIIDAESLRIRRELAGRAKGEPRAVIAAPEGRAFAILLRDGRLTLLDTHSDTVRDVGGDVAAVAFGGKGELAVADRAARVSRYDLQTLRLIDRRQGAMDLLQGVYRYFVLPFYRVFPKPGELGSVVTYLLSTQEAPTPGSSTAAEPRLAPEEIDVAGPLWSSLAFVLVMLGITCVILHRADIA